MEAEGNSVDTVNPWSTYEQVKGCWDVDNKKMGFQIPKVQLRASDVSPQGPLFSIVESTYHHAVGQFQVFPTLMLFRVIAGQSEEIVSDSTRETIISRHLTVTCTDFMCPVRLWASSAFIKAVVFVAVTWPTI